VKSRTLANTAWAVSKLLLRELPLLKCIARQVTHIGTTSFSPQELSNTAWSFATLDFFHPPLFAAIASASLPSITLFRSQELANMAWSVA